MQCGKVVVVLVVVVLAPLRPTRDPPGGALAEGLSRRGSRSPATHPRPTRDSPGGALAERLSRMGLSRTGSRGRALQLTRDPPGEALAERLSRTGSRRGILRRALADRALADRLSRTGSKKDHRSSHASPPPPPHSYRQMPGYWYLYIRHCAKGTMCVPNLMSSSLNSQ